jgi:hypothetical protein
MTRKIPSLALVALMVTALSGCSDKDRQVVSKTGDGTESFKFDEKAVPNPATVTPAPKARPNGDGSDTFKFDPKAVPGTVAPSTKGTGK